LLGVSNKILAVVIDACEPALLHPMIERGQLPHLSKIADQGTISTTDSYAEIGSGSVWPTFIHGTHPAQHGIYAEWMWSPAHMSVHRWGDAATPTFWSGLQNEGRPVGLLDVPFAPRLEQSDGFSISEWGAHDVLAGERFISPASVEDVVAATEAHPFGANPPTVTKEGDDDAFRAVLNAARDGITARAKLGAHLLERVQPDLALLCFPEFHHVAHYCWDEEAKPIEEPTTLRSLLMQIDLAVGELLQAGSAYDSVMVFGLHGFKPSRGIVNVLPALLSDAGLSVAPKWNGMTRAERKARVIAVAKRLAPTWVKDAYHRSTGPALQRKLAEVTMLEAQDWSRTKAFALPTDQHGWIRINMRGRERLGVVDPRDYALLREQISALCTSLRSDDGEALVDSTTFPFADEVDATTSGLPDVVVHWTPVAHRAHVSVDKSPIPAPLAPHLTGQHDRHGFSLAAGPLADRFTDEIHGETIGSRFVAQLRSG
jgi:predicted AlkP superfamily phosphohydrolase/phosphomutase